MRAEVMEHYGLAHPLSHAGYYETGLHKQLLKDIRGAILKAGCLWGCWQRQNCHHAALATATEGRKQVIVSKSLTVEKHSIKLTTLIAALYYDQVLN